MAEALVAAPFVVLGGAWPVEVQRDTVVAHSGEVVGEDPDAEVAAGSLAAFAESGTDSVPDVEPGVVLWVLTLLLPWVVELDALDLLMAWRAPLSTFLA